MFNNPEKEIFDHIFFRIFDFPSLLFFFAKGYQ
jgi:hypothetical protein